MKSSKLFFLLVFCMFAYSNVQGNAGVPLELQSFKQSQSAKPELSYYLQYGFKLGTDIMVSTKQLSVYDNLNQFYSGMFGFYVRGGYKYIFGELGFNYIFYKGRYEVTMNNGILLPEETVESRYFQIPLKVVGYIPIKDNFAFTPNVGIIYKPLIHVTKNDILYSKNNLQAHQFLFTAGVGFKIKFVTMDVAYCKDLKPYYQDKSSEKPSYINVSLGIMF